MDATDQVDSELKVIASRERRKVVDHFLTADTEVASVEVLSCKLARAKVDDAPGEAPSTETVKAALHHVHLPKLADHGLVEYDAQSGTVRYRPDERVEALVRFLAER